MSSDKDGNVVALSSKIAIEQAGDESRMSSRKSGIF
jgi:hypothetical protein